MQQTTVTGTIVDPVAKTSSHGRITISPQGRIAAIEPLPGSSTAFILPGFVDAHVHIESTMLTPAEFARAASLHGTLAAVTDPHEIANVLGASGVRLMLQLASQTPFVFGTGVPSCVPATPFETSGAAIGPGEVDKLLREPGITHLGEMMNVSGVLNKDPEVTAKLTAAQSLNLPIDGHAPGLAGEAMRQYAAAGITSDHECLSYEEAYMKIRSGIKLIIRHGSAASNIETFLALLARYPAMCMFCSDDKHPDDLLRGHINHTAALAFNKGLPLQTILQAACVNPVRHYNLPLGLLQPGDRADFQITDDLRTFRPREVWLRGQRVVSDGVSTLPPGTPVIRNNFNAATATLDALRLPAPPRHDIRAIGVTDGTLITRHIIEPPTLRDGLAVSDPDRDLLKIVLCNRYTPAPPVIAFVKGLGLRQGAIATSVSHDSHHIIGVGSSDSAIAAAINQVILHRGGLAVANAARRILASLPLPIAGLISPNPAPHVARAYSDCDRLAKILGSPLASPFMALSFLCLPVIPALKLTDKGLFDSEALRHVPLFLPSKA